MSQYNSLILVGRIVTLTNINNYSVDIQLFAKEISLQQIYVTRNVFVLSISCFASLCFT